MTPGISPLIGGRRIGFHELTNDKSYHRVFRWGRRYCL